MVNTLTSTDQQLLSNITTLHGWPLSQNCVDTLKKDLLKEVRKYIPQEVLEKPFVYIGSYTDIETPLFFGFSNIILVEIGLDSSKVLKRLREKIQVYSSYTETMVDGYRQIEMTLDGKKKTFTLIPKAFQDVQLAKDYNVPVLNDLPPDIGMVFSFAIANVNFYTEQIYNSLVPNGYLCATLRPKPELIGGILNKLHYKKFTIKSDRIGIVQFLQKTPK